MIQTIKKINGELIYSGEHELLKDAVEHCCKNNISLDGASLNVASLDGASLNWASLDGASLDGARYSILSMLKINFSDLSDVLTLELMRWDAVSCGVEKMNNWFNGGCCPFSIGVLCDFYFRENKNLWVPGSPTMNHRELWEALAKEKKITI